MTLRVAFLIPDFSDGGAQKQCILLLNALQRIPGIALTLVRFRPGRHDALLDTARLDLVTLDAKTNADPRIPFRVAAILRCSRADILLTWLISCDIHGPLIRLLAGRRLKWVMTERNSAYPAKLRFRLRRLGGHFADAIVSNSEAGDTLWTGRNPRRRHRVPNIVPPLQPAGNRTTIAYAGRLEPHKNVLALADALRHLATQRPAQRFEIIGQGSLATALRARTADTPNIHLTGFRSDFPAHLGTVRVLVSLSRHEGLPNVLLEAAASDTTIVASDIPEHRALLGPDYPYLVPLDAPSHVVADLIAKAADDPAASGHLAHARAAIATMSAQAIAARYMEIFRQVAGETT